MPLEIETDGDEPRPRKAQLPGGHQLPRSGKAMRDDHDRPFRLGQAHHGDGRLAHAVLRDGKPRARRFQPPKTQRDAQHRHACHDRLFHAATRHTNLPDT
jgi:hypothetical protein